MVRRSKLKGIPKSFINESDGEKYYFYDLYENYSDLKSDSNWFKSAEGKSVIEFQFEDNWILYVTE